MTSTALALPTSAEPRGWTPAQRNLMMFAGLAKNVPIPGGGGRTEVQVADMGVAEAFLAVCRRTGLDPFAKQIYAMEVSGRLSIVVGIDGFRIVAQRSHGYRGQIGPQWATGRMIRKPLVVGGHLVMVEGAPYMEEVPEWVDAWVPEMFGLPKDAKPVAARVGVLREGFDAPLWQVVTWAEFGVESRFRGDNWGVRPAHMLGIRAETHALRRTFPNDLSNLYTSEDFDDQAVAAPGSSDDSEKALIATINEIDDLAEMTRMFHELNALGISEGVRAAFMARGGFLTRQAQEAAKAQHEAEAASVRNGAESTASAAETGGQGSAPAPASPRPARGRTASDEAPPSYEDTPPADEYGVVEEGEVIEPGEGERAFRGR